MLHAVEHFFHHLDGLVGQDLALVLLLVPEGSALHEQPAQEHICIVALHVVFPLQLIPPRKADARGTLVFVDRDRRSLGFLPAFSLE